jgi:hypothetical protein
MSQMKSPPFPNRNLKVPECTVVEGVLAGPAEPIGRTRQLPMAAKSVGKSQEAGVNVK